MNPEWWVRARAASLAPTREEADALAARVRATRAAPRRSRRWIAAGLAVAAAVAVWLALPARERALQDTGAWVPLGSDVVAWPAGTGSWRGRTVNWDEGRLAVMVTPERGVDLRVLTPEAAVRVVGTVFDVERDATGTTVTVDRGHVEVTCAGAGQASTSTLGAGERRTCLRSAAAGLGLALRLERDGAPVDDWLAIAREAREMPADPAVRAELVGLAVDGALSLGRVDEAAALAADPGTPDAALGAVARALYDRDGCEPARGPLERLHTRGDGVASVLLADCTPAEAPRILAEALARHPEPEVAAAIAARTAR